MDAHTVSSDSRARSAAVVRSCFAAALDRDAVDADDSFFALGGHSMLGVRLVTDLRAAGLPKITLRELFDHPTPAGLTDLIDERVPGGGQDAATVKRSPALTPRPDGAEITLSFAQEGFLMLNELTGGDPDAYFNQRCAFLVEGVVDYDALDWALGRIVERHELLRTVEDGSAWRVLEGVKPSAARREAHGATPEDRMADARQLAAELSNEPFNLSRGPLVRLGAIHIEDETTGLVIVLSHIAADWVSLDIACRELAEHYRARLEGDRAAVPNLAVQYWDFALWQRKLAESGVFEDQLAYWDRKLADADMYLLPSELDHSDEDAEWEPYGRTHEFEVPAWEVAEVRAMATAHDATLFMAMLAATKVTIAEVTGKHRIAVAAFAANRDAPEVQDLIGIFPNIQILCTDMDGTQPFDHLLGQVRTTCIEAQSNGDVPFHSLLDVPCFARWMNRQDQHWVLFYLHEAAPWSLTLPGLRVSKWAEEVQSDAYPPVAGTLDPETGKPYLQIGPVDLDISFFPAERGYRCRLSYNVSVFDPRSIEAFAAQLAATIARVARARGRDARP